jgi:F0F1-type ATP synthase assembly protein I
MAEEEWRSRFDNRLERLETDMMAMKLRDAASDVHHQNVETRLKSIEGTLTWLVRLIIGGILGVVITFVVSGGTAL